MMLLVIVFLSCLLYPLSLGQTNSSVNQPTIGPIYPVANNDSLLNFTFLYPTNFRFDKLFVRFTIYDFIGNDTLNPQPYPFSWANFTNSNFSLPWVVPSIILQSGDYIIVCFEWLQMDNNSQTVSDIYQCVLTRTSMNSQLLSIGVPMISTAVVTNTNATISAYYPAGLPYDQVNITSTLNGTVLPSMTNLTSNGTYSNINTFTFTNLSSNTYYNICIGFNYANSKINGTQTINYQYQTIMTLADTPFTTIPTSNRSATSLANPSTTSFDNPATTSVSNPTTTSVNNPTTTSVNNPTTTSVNNPSTTSVSIPATTSVSNPTTTSVSNPTTTSPNNSSKKILSNLTFIILLFVIYFI